MTFGWRPGDGTRRGERRYTGERRSGRDRRAPVYPNPPTPPNRPPTPRQLDLLALVAVGRTLTEAARDLGITYQTAKNHGEDARERLGAQTLAHAVVECIVRGWLVPARDPRAPEEEV